jgi:hypothetical protein
MEEKFSYVTFRITLLLLVLSLVPHSLSVYGLRRSGYETPCLLFIFVRAG